MPRFPRIDISTTKVPRESGDTPSSPALSPGDFDIVSFSGFGTWSADRANGLHLATAQISLSTDFPHVSVMIDGGQVSNVNLKPEIAPIP